MAKREPERTKQRAMRHHQHRAGLNGGAVHRRHGTVMQRLKAFRAFRREAAFDPAIIPIAHGPAFFHAKAHFHQPRIRRDRQGKRLRHDFRGMQRAAERGSDDGRNPAIHQRQGRAPGLRNTNGIQRNIRMALAQPLSVPIGFAVAQEPEGGRVQAHESPSAFSVRCTAGRAFIRA